MPKLLRLFFSCLSCLFISFASKGQDLDSTMWTTDGTVHAVARHNNTVYLGGMFKYVGPHTGAGVVVNASDGTITQKDFYFTRSNYHNTGDVWASVADGSGGWFVGGAFSIRQGNVIRRYLAHILPDGNLDAAWHPTSSGLVTELALSGDTLYVVGQFNAINNQPRRYLAAISAQSGQVFPWSCTPNDEVIGLTVAKDLVYLNGRFNYVSGQFRNGLAAVNRFTGVITEWNPAVKGQVNSVAVAGDSILIGGEFTQVDGKPRNYLASLDAPSGRLLNWQPVVDGRVGIITLSGSKVYVSGSFATINQLARSRLASFDRATGQLTSWNPNPDSEIFDVRVLGEKVYVAGAFQLVDGQPRNFLAQFEASSGRLSGWNPGASGVARTVAPSPAGVFVGGMFKSVNCVSRDGLAALDAVTGRPTAWNAAPKALAAWDVPIIRTLEVTSNLLYVGGSFASIGGQPRNNLAAVDVVSGRTTAWNPAPNNYVSLIKVHGSRVYVAGRFTHIGGREKRYLAALDVPSGKASGWGASVYDVKSIAPTEHAVFVGGDFEGIPGGINRRLVAALHPATGEVLNWGPQIPFASSGDVVNSLAVVGNAVYLGGQFKFSHNGQVKENLMAIDIATGQVTPWSARAGYEVYALVAIGNLLYLSSANSFNGTWGKAFGAFDATTGQAIDAIPGLKGQISTLYPWNDVLYVLATYIGYWDKNLVNFAAFGRRTIATPNLIRGMVAERKSADCAPADTAKGLPNIIVVAEPGPYYGITDSLGNYTIAVDTGTYTIRQLLPEGPGNLITQTCPASPAVHTARFAATSQTVTGKDFGNQVTLRPYLTASVASTRRRRCFPGNTTLTYCNSGSLAMADAKVHLELPPHVVLAGASAAYSVAPDKHLVFDVGTLAPNGCGTIQVTDSVVCDNPDIRGLTQCTKVWITPANVTTPSPDWDGSDVTLKARCLPNGRVRLGLYNTGTGAMRDSSAFRIYLDAALALSRNFKLAKGDSLMLQVPANGQTVRLEADQRPGHPAKQSTNVSLEGCGTNAGGKVSLGFVAQLPQDDAEPEADTECLPITDSYDPNDKLVLPAGVTAEHYTAFGQELEYTVRFQNTGNDYAYRVVLVDTLSEKLDISTLRMNGASHPYQLGLSGKGRPVLTWTFDNINLPDSARDQAGSNGFVKFTIRPLKDLPEKTRIENFADIFFDYNPPVRTNTTLNTLFDLPRETTGGDALPLTVCTPNQPVTAGSNQAFCGNPTTVLQAQNPVHGQGRWQRISGAGRIAQPHQTTTAVEALGYGDNVFEWSIPDGSCAEDSLRTRVTVTRYRNPEKPAVSSLGVNELHSTVEGDAYQWYCNGHLLPDHARSIRADRGGLYTVRVSGGGDCPAAFSEPFDFRLTAPVLEHLSVIYPNPAGRDFTVALPGGLSQVTISLFDAQGKKVAESTTYNAGKEPLRRDFHLPACRAGVYLVKVQTPEALMVKRLVLR